MANSPQAVSQVPTRPSRRGTQIASPSSHMMEANSAGAPTGCMSHTPTSGQLPFSHSRACTMYRPSSVSITAGTKAKARSRAAATSSSSGTAAPRSSRRIRGEGAVSPGAGARSGRLRMELSGLMAVSARAPYSAGRRSFQGVARS